MARPWTPEPLPHLAAAVLFLGGRPSGLAAQSITLSPIMPVDASGSPPAASNYLDLGWQSFVAVSWPALPAQAEGIGGQPDQNLSISNPQVATLPTVWMTYLAKEQVFLPAAQNPRDLDQPDQGLSHDPQRPADPRLLRQNRDVHA